MAETELLSAIANFELDLKKYLQTRYLEKRIPLNAEFCRLLFAPGTSIEDIMQYKPGVEVILKSSPASTLQALVGAAEILGKMKQLPANKIIIPKYNIKGEEVDENNPIWNLATVSNELYSQNTSTALRIILQKNLYDLCACTNVFAIIDNDFVNTSTANIAQQVAAKYAVDNEYRDKLLAGYEPPCLDIADWVEKTKQNLKTYLQWKHVNTSESVEYKVKNFFKPRAVSEEFIKLLFSSADLTQITQSKKGFDDLLGDSVNSARAFKEALSQVEKDAQLVEPNVLQAHFANIMKTLGEKGRSSGLMTVLQIATQQLEMLANPAATTPTFDEQTRLKTMRDQVSEYIRLHPQEVVRGPSQSL